jgi:hypothetical protein
MDIKNPMLKTYLEESWEAEWCRALDPKLRRVAWLMQALDRFRVDAIQKAVNEDLDFRHWWETGEEKIEEIIGLLTSEEAREDLRYWYGEGRGAQSKPADQFRRFLGRKIGEEL